MGAAVLPPAPDADLRREGLATFFGSAGLSGFSGLSALALRARLARAAARRAIGTR